MTHNNDELYKKLHVLGSKVQDILKESEEVEIIGFVILAHDGDGNGTADARYRVSDSNFRDAMYAVADNLKPTGEKR